MKRYDRRLKVTAACLSALAGYVDTLGFLASGGFFVSFMSGNSTRLSVGIAERSTQALTAAALIAAFISGVIIGTTARRCVTRQRRATVLTVVTCLLFLAASLQAAGATWPAVIAIALAMGAENAVFERDGEVHIGLTYMTGTLVKLGQRITAALFGEHPFGWAPYLMLWLSLIVGALIGALVFPILGLGGLWLAAGFSAVLTIVAIRLDNDESSTR